MQYKPAQHPSAAQSAPSALVGQTSASVHLYLTGFGLSLPHEMRTLARLLGNVPRSIITQSSLMIDHRCWGCWARLRMQSELLPSACPVEEPSNDQSLKSWGFIDVMGFCALPQLASALLNVPLHVTQKCRSEAKGSAREGHARTWMTLVLDRISLKTSPCAQPHAWYVV